MIEARISSVRMIELSALLPDDPANRGFPPQSRAISVYDQFHPAEGWKPPEGPRRKTSLYVEIGTTAGVTGRYGPIDQEAVAPLAEGMASSLLGLDALANTYIWDMLSRANRHSRHGNRKIAMSAVDNALWDLRGRLLGVPVWQLLGGAGRQRIPAYASTLGTFHGEGEVEETAARLLDEGYTAQKWFFSDGPSQGPEGMERNVALVERTRGTVGDRSALMFDAFMSWDLAYARRWASRVEHLRPDWLEEPFPTGAIESFAQLRSSTSIPLATGEHLYDRHDILPFLQRGLLGVLQVDPEWCGGTTDLVRMCAMAEPFGVAVIPHGHGIHSALHVVASQSPEVCPRVEYLFHHMPERHYFEIDTPTPHGGSFALPTRPGFGIEFAEERIKESRDVFAVS
ncbi:L-alanine-DL-glutamate epimerase-like enolase superfamily enzyme [Paenarthrobacter nicotinovorans]|uniref:enolase C-terminal domain-like protein n=1 Tax=Paenarthrobacter nicotinovorans TaxID=29320 RepID=UPI00278773B7|nr:enolase C-terminal domain-like protein [Paenarthrobacter nicotinovorans]MDP9933817.1 L-alanine-DL-glutamate epimerase-like enolase superfamily enzyme [Paenarthrobacter nicotinovorans]